MRRAGVVLHEGSRLTAGVLMANFDFLRTFLLTKSAAAGITSTAIPDPSTVHFFLKGPSAGFPAGLTTQPGTVMAQFTLERAPSSPNALDTPRGDRSVQVCVMAAKQPLHGHRQSPLVAGAPLVSGPGHVPPHVGYHPTPGLTPEAIGGRHDLPRSSELPAFPQRARIVLQRRRVLPCPPLAL